MIDSIFVENSPILNFLRNRKKEILADRKSQPTVQHGLEAYQN